MSLNPNQYITINLCKDVRSYLGEMIAYMYLTIKDSGDPMETSSRSHGTNLLCGIE